MREGRSDTGCFLLSHCRSRGRTDAEKAISARRFPDHHRHPPRRPRPLLRLRKHSDAGTRRTGERRHSLHPGVHSQPDHQHFAHQHPDRPAAQHAMASPILPCLWRRRHPTLADVAEGERLSHRGVHRRGHPRQQDAGAGPGPRLRFLRQLSRAAARPNRAGDGWNAAARTSCSTRKPG